LGKFLPCIQLAFCLYLIINLRFQSHPDKVFTAILKGSIELMIDEINDTVSFVKNNDEINEHLNSLLPNASKVFNPQTATSTLRKLQICLDKPELYKLNDYHYLLLYDTLSNLCDLHNNAVRACETQEDRKPLSQIGDYYIEELLFDEMVDIYFYDIDFLFDPEDMFQLGLEGRKQMAINEETFAVIQGLIPHPEELELKECEGERSDSSPYFGSKSKVMP